MLRLHATLSYLTQILRGETEPPPELSSMTDKLALCCAPQMAGLRGAAAEPATAATAGAAVPAAPATTYTTTTTTTVPVEGAAVGAAGPAVVTPMR